MEAVRRKTGKPVQISLGEAMENKMEDGKRIVITLEEYLLAKYGMTTQALTETEARAFCIPYPLISGWPAFFATRGMTLDAAEQLLASFTTQRAKKRGGLARHRQKAVLILEEIIQREKNDDVG